MTYEQLISRTGAATLEEFKERLNAAGLRWYDESTYNMRFRAEDDDFIEKLQPEIRAQVPATATKMKLWAEKICLEFTPSLPDAPIDFSAPTACTSDCQGHCSNKVASTAKEKALDALFPIVEELATKVAIDYNALQDPLAFIGACTILGIDVKNVSLWDIIVQLQSEDDDNNV
jgi:hypothetical protein